MVKADHGYSKRFGKENVPFWERKRYCLDMAARENRQKQVDAMVKNARTKGQRPPLTKEQTQCGARRII
jgi:hypothetical protein